jgi:hypothetical protein
MMMNGPKTSEMPDMPSAKEMEKKMEDAENESAEEEKSEQAAPDKEETEK